jgi:hypothetical protein
LFREVNERIREAGEGYDIGAPLDFICECGDATCTARLPVTLDEYGQIRRTGTYFIVQPGHERSSQRLIRSTSDYVLVEDASNVGEPLPA